MLNTAIRAARAAGNVILRHMDRVDTLSVSVKSRNDFVSEVDRQAEQEIVRILLGTYPRHAVLAEEGGMQGESAEYRWIIDPLDGTTNFLHGFPQFAVSIALERRGVLDQAVIFDPVRNELFTASRGEGAQVNGKRMRVTRVDRLDGTLLGTGFPYREHDPFDPYIAVLKQLMPATAGIRRAGAASLDLAYVAAGRLDGFWESGLKAWDLAAGALLVQESGGLVSDYGGGEDFLSSGEIIAGPAAIHAALRAAIKPHLSAFRAPGNP